PEEAGTGLLDHLVLELGRDDPEAVKCQLGGVLECARRDLDPFHRSALPLLAPRPRAHALLTLAVRAAVRSLRAGSRRLGTLGGRALARLPALAAGGLTPPVAGSVLRGWVLGGGLGGRRTRGFRLEVAGRDRLVVELADHEVLLADAPDVRDDEVERRARVEREADEREEDREDLRDRLHLGVDRGVAALQLPRLGLLHLVPAGERHGRDHDVVRPRVGDPADVLRLPGREV